MDAPGAVGVGRDQEPCVALDGEMQARVMRVDGHQEARLRGMDEPGLARVKGRVPHHEASQGVALAVPGPGDAERRQEGWLRTPGEFHRIGWIGRVGGLEIETPDQPRLSPSWPVW